MLKQVKWHVLHSGGHGIHSVDGADDDTPLVGPLIIPDADGLDVGDGGEVLPHLALQAVLGELLPEDGVRLPDGLQPVPGDGAQAADAQTGAGEGLPVNHTVGQTQRLAAGADLVLKKHLQRLHQLEP